MFWWKAGENYVEYAQFEIANFVVHMSDMKKRAKTEHAFLDSLSLRETENDCQLTRNYFGNRCLSHTMMAAICIQMPVFCSIIASAKWEL